jgi:AraC family transcriptional regulator
VRVDCDSCSVHASRCWLDIFWDTPSTHSYFIAKIAKDAAVLSEDRKAKRSDTLEFHTRAVQRVIGTIRERLDDSISLKEMAALAYMSRFHFNRTFRRVTGLPPRRFLSALRVQSATRMLLDTDHSVTDICLDVGYNSLGTFVRRFSAVLGISPMRLRSMRRSSAITLLKEAQANPQAGTAGANPVIVGRIKAPVSFSGPIFIGLFASAIPEGAPVACAIRYSPGYFQIAGAPRGHHYLFAVGLPWPDKVSDYFRHDFAPRGGGELVCVDKDTVECGEICLRPALPTDPPILVNLPVLLSRVLRMRKVA